MEEAVRHYSWTNVHDQARQDNVLQCHLVEETMSTLVRQDCDLPRHNFKELITQQCKADCPLELFYPTLLAFKVWFFSSFIMLHQPAKSCWRKVCWYLTVVFLSFTRPAAFLYSRIQPNPSEEFSHTAGLQPRLLPWALSREDILNVAKFHHLHISPMRSASGWTADRSTWVDVKYSTT